MSLELDITVPLPLQFEWSFSYDEGCKKGANKTDYESSLKSLGVFSSVQDFWRYWNNMMMDGSENQLKFPEGANLRMFKSGIVPSWEDPANAKGGKWIITLHKEHSRKVWAELVLLLIGDQLEICEDLCGVVFAIRTTNDTIALWNRSGSDSKLIEAGSAELKERLSLAGKTTGFEYKPHQVSVEYNRSVQRAHRRQRSASMRKSPRLALSTSQDEFSEESDQFDSACSSAFGSPSYGNSPRLSRTSSHEGKLNGMASPQPLRANNSTSTPSSTSVSGRYLAYLTIPPEMPPSSVSPSYSDSNISSTGGATTPPLLSNSASASSFAGSNNGNKRSHHSRKTSDARTISPSASSGSLTPPSRVSGSGSTGATIATSASSSSVSNGTGTGSVGSSRRHLPRARSDVGTQSSSIALLAPVPSPAPSDSVNTSPEAPQPTALRVSPREVSAVSAVPTPTPVPQSPAPSRPSKTSQQRSYKESRAVAAVVQRPAVVAVPQTVVPVAAPNDTPPTPVPITVTPAPVSPRKTRAAVVVATETTAPSVAVTVVSPTVPVSPAAAVSAVSKKTRSTRPSRAVMAAVLFFLLLFTLCTFTYAMFVYGLLDSTPLRKFADVFRLIVGSGQTH